MNLPDTYFMEQALNAAREAALRDEVPIGAVIVHDNEIIAAFGNQKESTQDPLGHAEILAIRHAAAVLKRWRLWGCTLFVTLEPCAMCAGAIVQARLDRLVFAAHDLKAGGVGSVFDIVREKRLNHQPLVTEGILKEPAAQLLKDFFARKRKTFTSSPILE